MMKSPQFLLRDLFTATIFDTLLFPAIALRRALTDIPTHNATKEMEIDFGNPQEQLIADASLPILNQELEKEKGNLKNHLLELLKLNKQKIIAGNASYNDKTKSEEINIKIIQQQIREIMTRRANIRGKGNLNADASNDLTFDLKHRTLVTTK